MTNEKLLSRKELAAALGRAESYVDAMRKLGFEMPGKRAYLSRAVEFLKSNPTPRGGDLAGRGNQRRDTAS